MLNRRTSLSLGLAAILLCGPGAAAAQVSNPIRVIDIPPSRLEPRPDLELELPSAEEPREAAVAGPAVTPASDIGEVGGEDAMDAIAVAEAAKLRAANEAQLSAARLQLDQITAEQRAQQDRMARYREAESAHVAAMSDYAAQLAASRADRERWEADVAACRGGDRRRCAVNDGRR